MSDLRQIGLRLPESLIEQIDADAATHHQGRAEWIRAAWHSSPGPNASRNAALVDEVKVVDERAREVIKDLLRRMDQVEQTLEITPDPFA